MLITSPASDLLFLSSPDWSASLHPEEQKVGDPPVLALTWSSPGVVFKLPLLVNKTYFSSPKMKVCFCFQKDARTGVLCVKLHLKTTNNYR